MSLRFEVTVKCINEADDTCIYDCNATYSKQGNTLTQSEVDDHTKALASSILYLTSKLLKINEDGTFTEDTDLKEVKEEQQ